MIRTWLLILGTIATVTFAAIVLVGVPQLLLRSTEAPEPLAPYSPTELDGRRTYIENGCVYCHSQQVRSASFTTDSERGWGDRPTIPSDYVYDQPHLLGTMRTGPDLVNVGSRIPSRDWHLIHLYDPRAVVEWSIMPAFPYLFEEKDSASVAPDDYVVPVAEQHTPAGTAVVATREVLALVDYLLSLRRDYPVPADGGADGDSDGSAP